MLKPFNHENIQNIHTSVLDLPTAHKLRQNSVVPYLNKLHELSHNEINS